MLRDSTNLLSSAVLLLVLVVSGLPGLALGQQQRPANEAAELVQAAAVRATVVGKDAARSLTSGAAATRLQERIREPEAERVQRQPVRPRAATATIYNVGL